jgi:hypothetical protein
MIKLLIKLNKDGEYNTIFTDKDGDSTCIHIRVSNKERAIRAALEYIQINGIEYDELSLTVVDK